VKATVNVLARAYPLVHMHTVTWSQGHSPGEYGGGGGEGGLGGGGRMASTYIRFSRALCVLLDEPRYTVAHKESPPSVLPWPQKSP
jgi:hypothetical protein